MTKDEYWQKFSQTGRIDDYLAYAGYVDQNRKREKDSREDYSNTYAGISKCDGNDSQIRTDR